MERDYKLLADIDDSTIRWKCRVQILELKPPSSSLDGRTQYQRLTLIDEKANQMPATIFNNDIKLFEDILYKDRVYDISRATIKETKPVFRKNNNMFQMIISNRTNIEEIRDATIQIPVPEYNFAALGNLYDLPLATAGIDVLGVVIKLTSEQPKKRREGHSDVILREMTIVDRSMRPTTLTLWGTCFREECQAVNAIIDSYPVIVATDTILKEYNDVRSLSTTGNTTVLVNPCIAEALALQSWVEADNTILTDVLLTMDKTQPTDPHKHATLEVALDTANVGISFWIKAHVKCVLPQTKCWYMKCSNCHRKTSEPAGSTFICEKCNCASALAEPWCCVRVKLEDSTTTTNLTLFGNNAEMVLSCTAAQLMETQEEELFDLFDKWNKNSTNIDFMFHVKPVNNNTQGIQLNVLSVENVRI